jgi:hypothetical protein
MFKKLAVQQSLAIHQRLARLSVFICSSGAHPAAVMLLTLPLLCSRLTRLTRLVCVTAAVQAQAQACS